MNVLLRNIKFMQERERGGRKKEKAFEVKNLLPLTSHLKPNTETTKNFAHIYCSFDNFSKYEGL